MYTVALPAFEAEVHKYLGLVRTTKGLITSKFSRKLLLLPSILIKSLNILHDVFIQQPKEGGGGLGVDGGRLPKLPFATLLKYSHYKNNSYQVASMREGAG